MDTCKSITVSTFNVKNIKSNTVGVQDVLEKSDVLLMQEHWLFTHELSALKRIKKEFDTHSKAVDMECIIMPTQKPRGYGGSAVLFSTSIKTRKLQEGSDRITCVELPDSFPPLILCSVYMPAKGLKKRDEEYQGVLNELLVILETYSSSHAVLMGGDWNASFLHPSDGRDRMLIKFIEDNSLILTKK